MSTGHELMRVARRPHDHPEGPLDYGLSLRDISWGNHARLLDGGAEAFPLMHEAIAAAREEVLLESYIVEDDGTGRGFLEAVAAAARRGCKVRVVVDGIGSLGLPAARLQAIEQAGGQALVYRPVAPWRSRWGLWLRNHRKLLIVDRRVGFLGGLNLGDNYDERTGKARWHDLHMRLEGPAVETLRRIFATTWNEENEPARRMLRPSHSTMAAGPDAREVAPISGVPVQVIGNSGFGHRGYLRKAFLYAVKRAQRSVYIANPYFIPDRHVSRALRRAARRGVDVRVVVPARSDVLLVDLACRAALPHLLRDGVRVAEWGTGMMHAKVAAVDGRWATVGSYNLDHRSLRYNLEVTANVYDEAFAAQLEERLRADFDASVELSLASLLSRPLLAQLAEALAYRLRLLL